MGPCERKELFGFDFLHDGLPFDVLVAWIGNMATRHLTRYKWAIQFHLEPLAKLAVIRQRTPDPRNRRLELNALLDSVIHSMQPPSCLISLRHTKSNPAVALSAAGLMTYFTSCSNSSSPITLTPNPRALSSFD